MKEYGIILIGCGYIGCEHLRDIYFRTNIKIVAVVDQDLEKADLARRRYGAAHCGVDYHEFIGREDVDIVIIATNVDSHLDILKDCISAGRHVLCEKPIAKNEEEGKSFLNAVKAASVKISVAHILRYNETYLRVKKLIEEGAIGELKAVRMIQNQHAIDWHRYCRLLEDCSPIVDCGVHYFDVMQWFCNSPIVQVSGIGAVADDDLEPNTFNYGMVQMKTKSGVVGYYEAGWGKSFSSANVKEFIGSKGHISITLREFRSLHVEEGDLIELYLQDTNEYKNINIRTVYKPMWRQLSALIDEIEGRPSEMPSIDQLYSAFRVGLMADKAIRNNQVLQIEEE